MKSLKNSKQYLNNCGSTETFLDEKILKEKIFCDYNIKIKENPNYTILHSLFFWINKNLKYCENEKFRSENKFRRSAKEIWESGLATGCTDYAIVFATFARQLNVPTTILHTMSENFVKKTKQRVKDKHVGHAFCECYHENKWVLIDPANCKFIVDYNEEKIILNYSINSENIFIACDRSIDFEKQTIKEFNLKMDSLCYDLQI